MLVVIKQVLRHLQFNVISVFLRAFYKEFLKSVDINVKNLTFMFKPQHFTLYASY